MEIKLYDYQGVALNKVLYALRKFGRALMVMATGLGKTIVSVKIAEFFLSSNPGKRILFLSHDNGILEQSLLKYESIFGNRYSYARFFGVKKDWKADKHDIVFATFQSNPHKFFKADHFHLIIVDESHHSKADTYFDVLNYFTPMWKLGMTATPDRQDERDIRAIFGKEVVNYDLPEAMANAWLTPVEYKVLTDGLDREMLEAICNEVLVENIRITEGQLNDRIFIRARTEEQCKRILENTDNGLKAIVFCSNITHLNTLMELLPNSVAVHSDQTDEVNDESEKMYRSGLARHILVVDKYNEGKDLPDTDVLVFLRPTDSYRIWIQQLGRGLRLFPGKEKVIVLDFVGNIDRIKNLYTLITRIGQFGKNRKSQEFKLDSPLHLEGENFIFDFTSEIVNIFSVLERIALPFYETWQEASFATRSLGNVENSNDYRKKKLYLQDPRLHSLPAEFYKNFPGWNIFLGRGEVSNGWKTAGELGVNEKIRTPATIRKFVEKYRTKRPDWFKNFWLNNSFKEHYHPDLIKEVFLFLQKLEIAPVGWATASSLVKKGTSYKTIIKIAETYRIDHPEWFSEFRTKTNNSEHYHPKLVEIIQEKISAIERPPSGWMSIVTLSLKVRIYYMNLKVLVEQFRSENPQWFKTCLSNTGKKTEYYHPDLLKKIEKQFGREQKPDEWYSLGSLRSEDIITVSAKVFYAYVEQFRSENPQWFKVFLAGSRFTECYHPELVLKIKEYFVLLKEKK